MSIFLNKQYEEKTLQPNRCIITTNKRYMLIYEILYIVGLIAVLIGGIADYVLATTPQYLLLSIIIATSMFVTATVIWAVDRKCEPIHQSRKK